MSVRLMRPAELPQVTEMMRALWPDAGFYDFGDETVFVWERPQGALGGLVLFESLRGRLVRDANTVRRRLVGLRRTCGTREWVALY